jgi:hypothetical protein
MGIQEFILTHNQWLLLKKYSNKLIIKGIYFDIDH